MYLKEIFGLVSGVAYIFSGLFFELPKEHCLRLWLKQLVVRPKLMLLVVATFTTIDGAQEVFS